MSSPRRVQQAAAVADLHNGVDNNRTNSHGNPPKSPRSPSRTTKIVIGAPAPPSPINFDFKGVIKPQDLLELAACPCCKQCIDDRQQQTLSGVANNGPTTTFSDPYKYMTANGFDYDSEDEDTLPKGVAEGLNYHPRRILVEGWLHKKGTGKDWLGSRSWKPRWARLVMARLEGFEVDAPLLMIYWYTATASPSNVIILDSTVAVPIDLDDKERWDAYRFDIQNARTVTTNTGVNTCRTFCAPKKARDAWIYAISQALLMYEKANDKARKAAILASETRRVTPQQCCEPIFNRPMTPPYDEVWSGGNRFISPPRSANSPTKKGMSSPPRLASPPTSPSSKNPTLRVRQTPKHVVPRPNSSPQVPKPSPEK